MKIPQDMQAGCIHQTNEYGFLVVVDYTNSKTVKVRFADTGYESITKSDHIRHGRVKDPMRPKIYGVGFLGVGRHSSGKNGKNTYKYNVWRSMLARCYCPKTQIKQPTYIGCSVSPDWHNFQNFGDWFDDNYIDGFQLDKDKLSGCSRGKLYSKETCTFISPKENNTVSQAKEYKFKSPSGEVVVFVGLNEFCRNNNLTPVMHD